MLTISNCSTWAKALCILYSIKNISLVGKLVDATISRPGGYARLDCTVCIFSAPGDYSSFDEDITFSPSTVSFDVVIMLTDDNVFENEFKEFTIKLTLNSTTVIVEPAMATILITDDDRMLLHIIIKTSLLKTCVIVVSNNRVFCSAESDCSNIFVSDSVDNCCVTEVAQSYRNSTHSRICNFCYGEYIRNTCTEQFYLACNINLQ